MDVIQVKVWGKTFAGFFLLFYNSVKELSLAEM